jgi:hypothetical protein
VVNNVVIKEKTVVNITNIVYRNSKVDKAVVYLPRDRFGRAHERARLAERVNVREMTRVQGDLPVKPGPESVAIDTRKGIRPPRDMAARPTMVTRPPKETRLPWHGDASSVKQAPVAPVRVVPVPKREETRLRRPDYGTQGIEERPRPPQPPRLREMPATRSAPVPVEARERAGTRDPAPPAGMERQVRPTRDSQQQPGQVPPIRETEQARESREVRRERPEPAAPQQQEVRSRERVQEQERPLPGKPANRVYRKGGQDEPDKDRGRGQR